MQLEVGKIVDGKITGITKFGAFVELDGEGKKVGMVHISEVSDTYVNEISEHVKEGQAVKVKVLSISEEGKIALSIKKATPRQANAQDVPQKRNNFNKKDNNFKREGRPQGGAPNRRPNNNFGGDDRFANKARGNAAGGGNSFEDMLSKFMQSSDEKISDLKKSREVSRKGGSKRAK